MREFSDEFNIRIILEKITEMNQWISSVSRESFLNNRILQAACGKYLIDIFNACSELSDNIKDNTNIPWSDIRKMRDRLSHQYFGIKYTIVWETIQDDIPVLKNEMEMAIKKLTDG